MKIQFSKQKEDLVSAGQKRLLEIASYLLYNHLSIPFSREDHVILLSLQGICSSFIKILSDDKDLCNLFKNLHTEVSKDRARNMEEIRAILIEIYSYQTKDQ